MSPPSPAADGRFVVEHHGCRLSARVRGEGPPVVLIQGTGAHGGAWDPQADDLSKAYRCLTFDNRGMAQSQPLGAPTTIEQMAEDTRVLMDALGWESAHIVGHSMGGLIALHLAISARQRVRSLSLLCTFSRGRDATSLSAGMLWLGLRSYVGTRRMRRRAFVQIVLPPHLLGESDLWAERLAPLFGHDLADHPPVEMKQLAAMRAYDATPHLSSLAGIPTLVIGAQYDRIARPKIVQALTRNIPGSRWVTFPDAAHGVTIQCAAEINRLLAEHFSHANVLSRSA